MYQGRRDNPRSLRIVAALFFLTGVASVIEMIVLLAHATVSGNLGVLGLFIGLGLLRHSRGWRTCALFCLSLGFAVMPILLVLVLAGAPVNFKLLGLPSGTLPPALALILGIVWLAPAVWQCLVLTRPSVKRLFGLQSLPAGGTSACVNSAGSKE
jgi:hypothetical protein